MKYCKRCLYPENHPLNIIIDEEGICSGCRVHEEKFFINWEKKEEKLIKILNSYKNKSGLNYDCIIPVSGARDSYFIVNLIKNKYGLNPLLVRYNNHFNTHVGNRNYAYLKTIFNCDAIDCLVQPQKIKKITEVTLKKMGSIYWHILAGSTVFPVQIAVKLKIPLIIWGAHQGLDQVGMFSHDDEVEMTRKYRKEHDLMGYEAENLIGENQLTENDLAQFLYPTNIELERIGVRGIYLGNYIPWDSKTQHETMIKKYNFETMLQQRTFDYYNHTDCFHYTGLHDYIKFLKYGYGKITDHVSREIRWGRISRNEGIKLVENYQNILPSDTYLFTEWLNISEKELFSTVNNFRDSRIWEKKDSNWLLKDSIIHHKNNQVDSYLKTIKKSDSCSFILTSTKDSSKKENSYTLLEKGYVL